MPFWPLPSGYPTALDNFSAPQVDNVDVVWANHPNSLASAVTALEGKLNIDNAPVKNVGGLQFDPAGKAVNPAAANEPVIWIDNSSGPGFPIYYVDETGAQYDLRSAASAAFVGYGYTCTMGMAVRDLAWISGADTVDYADATAPSPFKPCHGIIINVYGGGTTCDIAYGAEITGLAGLTPGSHYFLEGSGLAPALVPPVGATIKQEVGFARSTTTLVFRPTIITEV